MRAWIASQVILLVGALGLPTTVRAQDLDSSTFTSKSQAEAYLKANPTGPRAKAAFLAIVEFDLARNNPGFSRSDIARGVNLSAPIGAAPTPQTPRPTSNEQTSDGDLY